MTPHTNSAYREGFSAWKMGSRRNRLRGIGRGTSLDYSTPGGTSFNNKAALSFYDEHPLMLSLASLSTRPSCWLLALTEAARRI